MNISPTSYGSNPTRDLKTNILYKKGNKHFPVFAPQVYDQRMPKLHKNRERVAQYQHNSKEFKVIQLEGGTLHISKQTNSSGNYTTILIDMLLQFNVQSTYNQFQALGAISSSEIWTYKEKRIL